MDFIFNFWEAAPGPWKRACVSLALLGLAACGGKAPAPAAHVGAGDGGDAQRLVALVDYIGGDYGGAVRDGDVQSRIEYEEQLRFAADARKLAHGLLGGSASAEDPLLAALADVEFLVRTKADVEVVGKACRLSREEAVTRFGLRTMPT